MKVIDDFLPDYYFKSIHNTLLGFEFPWYYYKHVNYSDIEDDMFQFVHVFYDEENPTQRFSLMEMCLRQLGVRNLYRIKANLNPRTFFHRKTGYHVDMERWGPHQTAVYYVNSNNGYTEFKKGGKVKSVSNRIVIFDSNLEHTGVTCTDEKRRVVINFNYDV
ncbi:MAG: 2OG-Fe(II) oxygenase [Pseudomonadota bacterium]|nr:2OG-Fe(II) oxygenase [Pseudomonadota bacterium]